MKITDVEALYLRLPEIKARTDSSQDALIVRVSTDAGITGYGEVDGCPHVTKAVIDAPYSHMMVRGLRQSIEGEDPLEIERLWDKMYRDTLYYGREGAVIQAMAGIDLALWDIKGKALGQPVYKLLGGGHRKRMRTYSSNMFQFSPADTARRAAEAMDNGFTAVKFGWEPLDPDPALDEALVAAIRKQVGDGVDVMIDAGLAWDAKTTLQRLELFAPYRIFWLEEPLPPHDLRGGGIGRDADRGRRAGVHGTGLSPVDGRGPDRRGANRPGARRPDAADEDRIPRTGARHTLLQSQLHDGHQRRRLVAFPVRDPERPDHGVLLRAERDLARSREEPDNGR